MHRDWIWGFGAASTLVFCMGIDLAISVFADRSLAVIRRGVRRQR